MRNIKLEQDNFEHLTNEQTAIDNMNKYINNFKGQTVDLQEDIIKTTIDYENINKNIKEKDLLIYQNNDTIKKKYNLLDDRNRMLELSIDKNIYAKKVVYTLLAISISIIIIILFVISFFRNIKK